MKKKYFLIGIVTSLATSFATAASVYLLIIGLNSFINFSDIVVVFQASNFAAAASMIPGGVVVLEGGLVGLLVLYGIKYEAALAVSRIIRLLSTGLYSAIGLFCLRLISSAREVKPKT